MDNKRIDIFYDQVDKACMILYNELKIDYIKALTRVSRDLVHELDEMGLSDEAITDLNDIYNYLRSISFFNEEIRLALQLLIIKGFKHVGYSLDLMTPDSIGYIIAYMITKLCPYPIDILDTSIGTGNLLNAIMNYPEIEVLEAIGIDNDLDLVNLCASTSDLMNSGIKVYYQNAISPIVDTVDIVVGDLPASLVPEQDGYNYSPYLIMKERLSNLRDGGYFIYLINNDFFSYPNSPKFKQEIESECTLLGLFVLDNSMFKENTVGKSILVGVKDKLDSFDMLVQMVRFDKEEEIQKLLNAIEKWINKFRRKY